MGENSLQKELTRHTGLPVHIVFTRNIRRLVTVRRTGKGISVRLHEDLAAPTGKVRDAVLRFVSEGCKKSSAVIREHLAKIQPVTPRAQVRLRPRGHDHHLDELLEQMASHFPGADLPQITWGVRRRPGALRVRLGSYDPSRKLIRVNPVLDHPDVPAAVVRYVIWHEMAHHTLTDSNGERLHGERHHGPRFKALERKCPDFDAALGWESIHLPARLRAARKARR